MKGVGYPQFYLGGDGIKLPSFGHPNNIKYGLSSVTYIGNCVTNLDRMCQTTFKPVSIPFATDYHAELDDSALLSSRDMKKKKITALFLVVPTG